MADKTWIHTRIWRCLGCEDEPEFEHAEMLKHMQEVHGFDPKTTKGTRQMIMHLDGQGFHQSTFEWEINGMKFLSFHNSERSNAKAEEQ